MNQQNVSFDYVLKNIGQLDRVKDLTLVKKFHHIFEQNLGLHPDAFDDADSGWPEELKPVCAEMWRRTESQASTVKLDQMSYINEAFRKLMADFARKQAGKRSFSKGKAVEA